MKYPELPSVRVLIPGTTPRYRCGGLSVELETAKILSEITDVQIVTYRSKEPNHPYLDDILGDEMKVISTASGQKPLWIISWGFDVDKLLHRLRGQDCIYHAHSTGYNLKLPYGLPVVSVSRNTLGYWGDRASRNPLFFIPNSLSTEWIRKGDRDHRTNRHIDVLIQKRKSSHYVLQQLVPALKRRGMNIRIIDEWVEDLVALFNQSKVYIYDSSEHWRSAGLTEGFGLPPVEALASGCIVFTSFNHALADFLDLGRNSNQIGCGNLEYDVDRICDAIVNPDEWWPCQESIDRVLVDLSRDKASQAWARVLKEVTLFYGSYYHRGLLRPRSLFVLWLHKLTDKSRKLMGLVIRRLNNAI